MNIGELFHGLDRDAVIAAIETNYPDERKNRNGYLRAWAEIIGLQPQPTDLVCQLKLRKADPADPDDTDQITISGLRPGEETPYGIELVPWEQWLSMDVVFDGIDNMKTNDVLAHVFWEMTWAGYDRKTIAGKFEEIVDQVDQIKDMHASLPSTIPGRLH